MKLKKSDLTNIIRAIAKERRAYFYKDDKYSYVSESHFIIRTNEKFSKYIIDQVNKRVRKPEWEEYKYLPNFFDIDGTLCEKIEEQTHSDGRKILYLESDNKRAKINILFTVPGGRFYINGKRNPVYEVVGESNSSEAVIMILPINW